MFWLVQIFYMIPHRAARTYLQTAVRPLFLTQRSEAAPDLQPIFDLSAEHFGGIMRLMGVR